MHPWVWGRMRLYGVQGTQSVRADDEPETRPIIGEEGSTLRLTTTERRLKPRTSPESQPRLGFTGASKKFCPSSFFSIRPPPVSNLSGQRVREGASHCCHWLARLVSERLQVWSRAPMLRLLCGPSAGPGPPDLVHPDRCRQRTLERSAGPYGVSSISSCRASSPKSPAYFVVCQ
jgi:hypothetical protein